MRDMHEIYVADPVQKILSVRIRRIVLYKKYNTMGPGCQNYRLDTTQETTITNISSGETNFLYSKYFGKVCLIHSVSELEGKTNNSTDHKYERKSSQTGGKLPEIIFIQISCYRQVSKIVHTNLLMTTTNKTPTRCTIVLKSLKLYCILIPLYMFRALLRPSSGAS
jgi:hypothetical protein